MPIPGNMMSPRMKLEDGEQVIHTVEGMRKKGIFGNRFGTLYLTDRRVAFVKAIMKSGLISMAMNAKGVKPMLQWPRDAVATDKVHTKKQLALLVTAGEKTEQFWMSEQEIDEFLSKMS